MKCMELTSALLSTSAKEDIPSRVQFKTLLHTKGSGVGSPGTGEAKFCELTAGSQVSCAIQDECIVE